MHCSRCTVCFARASARLKHNNPTRRAVNPELDSIFCLPVNHLAILDAVVDTMPMHEINALPVDNLPGRR